MPVSGLDCDIEDTSIFSLAVVSLILGMIAMCFFLVQIYRSLTVSLAMNVKLKFQLTYMVQNIAANLYCIALIQEPESAIFGWSIYSTVLGSVGFMTAYAGLLVFFGAVMDLLIGICGGISPGSSELMSESISKFYHRSRYLYAMCIMFSLVCFAGLTVQPDMSYIVAKAWFICWDVFHLCFLCTFNPPINIIRQQLDIYLTQSKHYGTCFAGDANMFRDIRCYI